MGKDNWISVKDKLPEFDIEVLTSWRSDSSTFIEINYVESITTYASGSSARWKGIEPTHWQPLPSPPKYK